MTTKWLLLYSLTRGGGSGLVQSSPGPWHSTTPWNRVQSGFNFVDLGQIFFAMLQGTFNPYFTQDLKHVNLFLCSQTQDSYGIHKICKVWKFVLSSISKIFFSIRCEIKCNMYAHIFVCKSCQFHAILEELELISWFADKKWLSETGNWCPKWQAKARVSRTGFRQNWCPILWTIVHYLNLHIFLKNFTPILLWCQATCSRKNIF